MALAPDAALREAARNATAHRATTVMLALVTLAVTAVTFLTVGRTAALEAEVIASVDAAGPRLVTVTITEPSDGVDADAIDRIQAIGGVEWVLALGPAADVRSAALASRANVAARALLTDLPALVDVELGHAPLPGQAIIGRDTQRRLQLLEPSGSLIDDGDARAIVGRFTSGGVIANLDRLVLTRPEDAEAVRATLLYVLAAEPSYVEQIGEQITALAGVPRDNVAIETSPELIELGDVLSGTLGALARQLATGAILVGMVLTALTMTLALNSRRRDFGRRRALGASRSALIALTLVEAAIPVTAGALIGAVGSLVAVAAVAGALPPLGFILAATALIVVTGTIAALPPAAIAAWQDPLRILRVP